MLTLSLAPTAVAVPEDGLSARVRSTNGFHGDGVGSGEIRFNSWDAVPDSGNCSPG